MFSQRMIIDWVKGCMAYEGVKLGSRSKKTWTEVSLSRLFSLWVMWTRPLYWIIRSSWFLVHPASKTHWATWFLQILLSSAASSTSSQLMPIFLRSFFIHSFNRFFNENTVITQWFDNMQCIKHVVTCRCLDDIYPVLSRSTWPPPETLGFPYESLSRKSKEEVAELEEFNKQCKVV